MRLVQPRLQTGLKISLRVESPQSSSLPASGARDDPAIQWRFKPQTHLMMQLGTMQILLKRHLCLIFLTIMLALQGTSCMSWQPGWEQFEPSPGTRQSSGSVEEIQIAFKEASTREMLDELLSQYESIRAAYPKNYNVLTNLCTYYTLMGAGYSENRSDKARYYKRAIRNCEQAMYLNPDFRERVDSGASVWDAVQTLSKDESDSMGYWVTAVFFYFKEVVPDPLKVINARWLSRNRLVMERIDDIDPYWRNGANLFNLGIYYLATPKTMGGDLDRAAEYFEKAASAGPNSLIPPWGRAKYLYPLTGNREAFKKDLEWVLGRDPRDTNEPYAWSVYFQREADMLLNRMPAIF